MVENVRADAAGLSGFAALDDRLQRATPGCLLVRVPVRDASRAVLAHGARRLAGLGFIVVHGRAGASAPLFRDVADRLGLALTDTDPSRFAERIGAALRAKRAALVAERPAPSSWDYQVAVELARDDVFMMLTVEHGGLDTDGAVEAFEVPRHLEASDRKRWAAALADDAFSALAYDDLATLESWWARAQRVPARAARAPLAAEPQALLARLAATGRAWPLAHIETFGTRAALDVLVEEGLVHIDSGFVVTDEPATFDARDATLVAEALELSFADDPWALSHAAGLFLRADQIERARDVFTRVMTCAQGTARREFVAHWLDACESVTTTQRTDLVALAAKLALDGGDSEDALRLAQRAAALEPTRADLAIAMGRAAIATGDLVTARVSLTRARELSSDAPDALVELAELGYLTGDHEGAASLIKPALQSTDPRLLLAARGVQGKLLLAKNDLDGAERHFAEDAWTASIHGLATASRRARLNRAIALMLKGQLGEAQTLLEAVRTEGELAREVQSQAYALENLSALAARQQEFGAALAFADEALELRRRQGDRLRTVRLLVTVAMLRRTLGLFEHAAHAIRFGRRVLGPGMAVDAAPDFGLIAARLAVDSGHPEEGLREVERTLVEGQTARDRDRVLGAAYRTLARIALEDGNVARAKQALASAAAFSGDDEVTLEHGYLEALVARAEGSLTSERVERVIELTKGIGDQELVREAHLLAVEFYRHVDATVARTHLDRALALRDRVARSLRGEVRDAFLKRRDVLLLDRLAAELCLAESIAENEAESIAPPTRRTMPPTRRTQERSLVGEDPAIRSLRAAIRRVAASDATVLIRGESGTGKELVAEALHRASPRADGPLVTVNCAALVETLLLSELFGHEKGAFTGAAARRRGRFELAEGGTLFLDEIGDISARTQVALLRVLQEKTFERVGGTTSIRANVRIVCATHRDLRAMVERGEFREDLYYRLRGITLEVPALRQRIGDLPAIAEHLLDRIAEERSEPAKRLSPGAVELLQRHRWPGNVRELENALRAASLFADGLDIEVRDLVDNVDDLRGLGDRLGSVPPAAPSVVPLSLPSIPAPLATLPSLGSATDVTTDLEGEPGEDDENGALPPGETQATIVAYAAVRQGTVSLGDLKRQIERDCVARALAETKGNITRAAALLGMKRPRLSQLVKQYGLAVVSEGSS